MTDRGDLISILKLLSGHGFNNSLPGFSHEETLHDGTAQFVTNEEILRDRLERPDIDS